MKRALPLSMFLLSLVAAAASGQTPRTGPAAFGDWREDAPGVARLITPDALPLPNASRSSARTPSVISRPAGALPAAPPGFDVTIFASGLEQPRTMQVAPNGDVFVAESGAGRVRVFRAGQGAGRPASGGVFATGLTLPFGLAFWPLGPQPRFIYVAETNRVVRFPYTSGDLRARGPAQTIVAHLPEGGHWTRDIQFLPDQHRMLVAVGSAGNVAGEMRGQPPDGLPLGAAWDYELHRATVLSFTPDGKDKRLFATGLRNCSAMAIHPATGMPWCVVNERDGLGDDLPPDYATEVKEGHFYGWPWYYIGANQDPRHPGQRPDLAEHVTVPDVLFQAHSAPLGIAFYSGSQFPAAYHGDAFVALRGSWNRSRRTGYKVVRLRFADGKPTGVYEDFLTGFVASDQAVWARPVGVAVTRDGALLVSEDGNGTIWHVAYRGQIR